MKYQDTEIPNNEMTNKFKTNQKLNIIKRAKSIEKESKSKDKNLEKNKSNDEIFASSKNNNNNKKYKDSIKQNWKAI